MSGALSFDLKAETEALRAKYLEVGPLRFALLCISRMLLSYLRAFFYMSICVPVPFDCLSSPACVYLFQLLLLCVSVASGRHFVLVCGVFLSLPLPDFLRYILFFTPCALILFLSPSATFGAHM